jgi:hypothetical protein
LFVTLDRQKDEKPDAPQETRIEGQRRNWEPDPEWLEMVSQQTYETLRDQWMPELPPIEFGAYLVPYLMEIGPTVATGMGVGPITAAHIDPWSRMMGIQFSPWEFQWLVRLSKEYLSEQSKSSKHFSPPPWRADES